MSTRFQYVESVWLTDPGLIRENNEDSFCVLPEDGFWAVADGMGGGEFGEVASKCVTDSLQRVLKDSADFSPGDRKYTVQQTIHEANMKIRDYARKKSLQSIGTTLVALQLDSWNSAVARICHIGDSRLYCYRSGELFCMTDDHTLLAENAARKKNGKVKLDERFAGILTRAIGISDCIMPEWNEITVYPEDIFLLCSDGVSSVIKESVIAECFHKNNTIREITDSLKTEVLAAGARDNFTMICCRIAKILPVKISPSAEEKEESDYLLKISENRIDHAKH